MHVGSFSTPGQGRYLKADQREQELHVTALVPKGNIGIQEEVELPSGWNMTLSRTSTQKQAPFVLKIKVYSYV